MEIGRITFSQRQPLFPDPFPKWTGHRPAARVVAQGWECPKCGAVMAPSAVACIHCVPNRSAVTLDDIEVDQTRPAGDMIVRRNA